MVVPVHFWGKGSVGRFEFVTLRVYPLKGLEPLVIHSPDTYYTIAARMPTAQRNFVRQAIACLPRIAVAHCKLGYIALHVRMDGLGLVYPVNQSRQEYEASIKATGPLVKQIARQAVEPPNDEYVAVAQRCSRQEKADSARCDQGCVTLCL